MSIFRTSGSKGTSIRTATTNFSNRILELTDTSGVSLRIDLDTPHSTHVPTFTTGDCIQGSVSLTAKSDARFDELEIFFLGAFFLVHDFFSKKKR